jgi:hypothetical protein
MKMFFSNDFLKKKFEKKMDIQNAFSTKPSPLIDVYCRMLPILCAGHLEFVPQHEPKQKQ